MVVFRCTQRVLRRFRLAPVETEAASTGVLGDWYANLLNFGPRRYVLCQSERSLLPVIVPARNALFPSKFGEALQQLLLALGVPLGCVAREVAAVGEVQIARTRSRQVLGAMNDFAYNAQVCLAYARSDDAPLEVCLTLAEMPSKPIGHDSPARLARLLFESPGLN